MNLDRREFIQKAPILAAAGVMMAEAAHAADERARPTVRPSAFAAPLIWQNAQLHNVDHVEPNPDGDGVRLSRVPREVWAKLNPMGKTRAFAAAGAEVRFNLVGSEARVFLRFVENRGGKAQDWPVLAELYQGGFLMRCVEFTRSWMAIRITKRSNSAALANE